MKRNDFPKEEEEKVSPTAATDSAPSRGQHNDDKELFEIIVKNLSYDADQQEIGEFFEQYGAISRVNILKNADGQSKGVAFVRFETEEGQNSAIESANGAEHLGRSIFVEKALKRGQQRQQPQGQGQGYGRDTRGGRGAPRENQTYEERPAADQEDTRTVFVGNLSFKADENALQEFFYGCGDIKNTRIIRDYETGKHKGYGYVEFSDSAAVQEAIKLSGQDLEGRTIKVDLAISKPKQGGGGGNRQQGGYGQQQGGARRGPPRTENNNRRDNNTNVTITREKRV